MTRYITCKWVVTTERAESSYGLPVYVAGHCAHGENVAHSLAEAIGCGLLKALREVRGLTQAEAASQIGVQLNTWARWERGEMTPRTGPAVAVLRNWIA